MLFTIYYLQFFQEVRELKDQLNSVEIKIEAAPGPDLMGMIEEIRAQYEKLAAQNKLEAEDMIKARVAKAQEQSKKDAEQVRDFKEQIGEYRKTVQTLHMEIDSLRAAVSFSFKTRNQFINASFSCMSGDFFNFSTIFLQLYDPVLSRFLLH